MHNANLVQTEVADCNYHSEMPDNPRRDTTMRNKILQITRRTIPYVRDLNVFTGSVHGSLIMQQLDYYFEQYPSGFYKFLKPCAHKDYKTGDSWTEELGMTEDEFITAFKRIGVRHKSKSLWASAENKFVNSDAEKNNLKPEGSEVKLYASYSDRQLGLTYYFRNHALVDRLLDEMISTGGNAKAITKNDYSKWQKPIYRKTGKPVYSKSTLLVSVNRDSPSLETGNPDLHSYIDTENTRDHHTQHTPGSVTADEQRVCVKSKYTLPQILEYLQHCRRSGQNIKTVQGLAITMQRTGEADVLVAEYYAALTAAEPKSHEPSVVVEPDADIMAEYTEHRATLDREKQNKLNKDLT